LKKKYDVIVCGAGPAGSVAAICLKRKGLSVLLIDEKEFPRDKVCGDQITPLGIDLLKELGVVDSDFMMFSNEIYKIMIKGPQKAIANVEFDLSEHQSPIFITPRIDLDNHLVKKGKELGIERHISRVFKIENLPDSILVKSKNNNSEFSFEGRVLIGADGSSSTIARLANLKPVKRRGIAIRAYLKGIDLKVDTLEGYFGKQWLPGYAWMFPTSDSSANIGLGMNVRHYKKSTSNLKELLNIFVDQPYMKSRLSSDFKIENIGTWPLNIGPPRWSQLCKDRILLIGDAASLINPFTGGGIETGIISGKLAAEVIEQNIVSNDFSKKSLRVYIKKLKRKLNLEQTLFLFAVNIVGAAPWIVESLIRFVEISDLPFIFMKYMYKGNKVKRIEKQKSIS